MHVKHYQKEMYMEEFKAVVIGVGAEYVLIESADPLQSCDNRLHWEHYSIPVSTDFGVDWRRSDLDERRGIYHKSRVTFRPDGTWVYTSDYERELSYAEISTFDTRALTDSLIA